MPALLYILHSFRRIKMAQRTANDYVAFKGEHTVKNYSSPGFSANLFNQMSLKALFPRSQVEYELINKSRMADKSFM